MVVRLDEQRELEIISNCALYSIEMTADVAVQLLIKQRDQSCRAPSLLRSIGRRVYV